MRAFLQDERGATAIENAFICLMIVLVVIVGIIALGNRVGASYNDTANKVAGAMR